MKLMTIEEMREHEWYVSWSGGKDSTATILLMHEHNIPIKKIVYLRLMYDDTLPATLPVMTNFVDKMIDKFREWGIDVEVRYPKRTFVDIENKTYTRSKYKTRNGKKYGITAALRGYCNMSSDKQKTLSKIANENAIEYRMIGYASDEIKRVEKLGGYYQSIMATLGVTESDAMNICKEHNMLSPLYELGFSRDGCWFCPNVRVKDRAWMRENYPELVEKINNCIKNTEFELSEKEIKRNNWLKDYYKENKNEEESGDKN